MTGAANHGVDLDSCNAVKGFNIASTQGGQTGIDDGGAGGGTVGTLTISDVDPSGSGKAIDIDEGGALNVTIDSLGSTGSARQGVDLQGGERLVHRQRRRHQRRCRHRLQHRRRHALQHLRGNITRGKSAALASVSGRHNTGTVPFNCTLSATSGTGLQFDNADGTYNLNGTNTLNGPCQPSASSASKKPQRLRAVCRPSI